MFFPVKADKLSGLLRRFKNRGYPKIKFSPSSTSGEFVANNILEYNNVNAHWASNTSEGLNAHFDVKIVSGVLRITHYSIKSHDTAFQYMRAWSLEGSNDNINYTMLDDRPENDDLNCSGIGQYEINKEKNFYQYFRIKQTMRNKSDSKMRIFRLDFYGEFLPFKLNSCKYSRNNYNILAILINVILSS